ncbi:threonine transporter RhtB [Streptomyces longispororuber]|uniref:Threonine transporter RhtB n=1 Tax=Streptomyces longispororuber TaxID=68230 RepID=A0A919DEG4_9ACTN|nr:LysE family translocator [Streptomyces longispororuber]GHE35522.1 threonine transporter RhtB [Streptomyces longispororuber]
MDWHQVLAFTAAIVPLALIPGTSLTLVTQRVLAGSRADGVRVTLGSACGLLVHAALAAAGLSALVMTSARALTVVRLLGGLYLVWLGVTTWRAAGRGAGAGVDTTGRGRWSPPWARAGGFGQGLWSNVLNPKAASVHLTLVPQFLTAGRPLAPQIAVLAFVQVSVVLAWLLSWTVVVAAARAVCDTPHFRCGVSRLAGAVLVGFGVRTVAAK